MKSGSAPLESSYVHRGRESRSQLSPTPTAAIDPSIRPSVASARPRPSAPGSLSQRCFLRHSRGTTGAAEGRERERWACHDVRVATEESGSEARTESAEADYDDDNSEGGPTTTPPFAFGVALKAAISEQLRFGTGVMKSERDGDVEHACLSPFAPAPSDLNP